MRQDAASEDDARTDELEPDRHPLIDDPVVPVAADARVRGRQVPREEAPQCPGAPGVQDVAAPERLAEVREDRRPGDAVEAPQVPRTVAVELGAQDVRDHQGGDDGQHERAHPRDHHERAQHAEHRRAEEGQDHGHRLVDGGEVLDEAVEHPAARGRVEEGQACPENATQQPAVHALGGGDRPEDQQEGRARLEQAARRPERPVDRHVVVGRVGRRSIVRRSSSSSSSSSSSCCCRRYRVGPPGEPVRRKDTDRRGSQERRDEQDPERQRAEPAEVPPEHPPADYTDSPLLVVVVIIVAVVVVAAAAAAVAVLLGATADFLAALGFCVVLPVSLGLTVATVAGSSTCRTRHSRRSTRRSTC